MSVLTRDDDDEDEGEDESSKVVADGVLLWSSERVRFWIILMDAK